MNIFNLLLGEITQNDLLNYYNATIIYEKLPSKVNGYVFDYDNVNFIVINKYLPYYKKRKTILHELAHIEMCHLNQKDKDLLSFKTDRFEDEAEWYLNFINDTIKEVKFL